MIGNDVLSILVKNKQDAEKYKAQKYQEIIAMSKEWFGILAKISNNQGQEGVLQLQRDLTGITLIGVALGSPFLHEKPNKFGNFLACKADEVRNVQILFENLVENNCP